MCLLESNIDRHPAKAALLDAAEKELLDFEWFVSGALAWYKLRSITAHTTKTPSQNPPLAGAERLHAKSKFSFCEAPESQNLIT